ncbi:MAG: 4-hydroxy-tetrahydrodipicolinate reductase [Acidimicrobiales bacterium]
MAITVGVFGASGRMGRTVCAAVNADPETELVAAVDPFAVGDRVEGVTIAADPEAMSETGVAVAVDFTVASAARSNVEWAAKHGLHAVVGTSGFTADDLTSFRAAFEAAGRACVVAPNFAIGAVLAIRLAELAAPYFDTAEVIELHHDAKRDAPSGTAMHTVERLAAASPDWADDPTVDEMIPGARGGLGPAGIRVHSVRMRGMVAHEEVLLGTTGQTLSIRHDSYDRTSFMPGVLLAIKRVGSLPPGLTVGLDSLLDL